MEGTGLFVIGLAGVLFLILLFAALYVVFALVFYTIFKKANVNNPWMAWIPVANMIPFFDTIGISRQNIWWVIVGAVLAIIQRPVLLLGGNWLFIIFGAYDIVYFVLLIIWYAKLLKAFGVSPLWLLLLIGLVIPILNGFVGIALLVLLLVFAFNKNIQYKGIHR